MANKRFLIRKIQSSDNESIAKIIRTSLEEFGANKPGTAYYDKEIDTLSEVFKAASSGYFVVMADEWVVGGAGFFPTKNLPPNTCELVKMYMSGGVRGKGLGNSLLQKCMTAAKNAGYREMYLETLPELEAAVRFYARNGFKEIAKPLGNSGHTGCSIFMLRKL